MNNVELRSRPLSKDRDVLLKEIKSVTDTVTDAVTDLVQTDSNYQNKLESEALRLAESVFEPGFFEGFWPHRANVRSLRLTSTDRSIPHELALLRSPKNDDSDEKFLCEYGLVRSISGANPPLQLNLNKITYLNAHYDNQSYLDVKGLNPSGDENSEWAGSTEFEQIESSDTALLEALGTADFDALHITCHGRVSLKNALKTEIIVGDELGSDEETELKSITPHQIKVALLKNKAFRKRRPIIFFNACETGRNRQALNLWYGWADIFLKAGAGAFVGTAWPVKNGPANAFASAFYSSLKQGKTLAEASIAARNAAKFEDASWLAYRVYGEPSARVV